MLGLKAKGLHHYLANFFFFFFFKSVKLVETKYWVINLPMAQDFEFLFYFFKQNNIIEMRTESGGSFMGKKSGF